MTYSVDKTDAQWRAELTPEQYQVLREASTERPWTGELLDESRAGLYTCAACGAELFQSGTKFDSHCGWPSFYESVRPEAVELIEDRFADYKSSKALSLIADNAWNGGIVVGPATPLPAGLDLDGIAGVLRSNGNEVGTGKTDNPLGALAWLANQAAECGRPMTAGMVVITGSVIPTVDIAPGERLDFALHGIGGAALTAT